MASHVYNMNDPVVLRAMGALVRDWVLNERAPVGDPEQTLADLYAAGVRLQDAEGNALPIEDCPVKVVLHQNSETEFHIVVPAKAQLETILARVSDDAAGYMLDQEFLTFMSPPAKSRDERLSFYDFRLGDYVLQHCD